MSCSIDIDQCVSCGTCWEECPHDAIRENDDFGYLMILKEKCICCEPEYDEPQCDLACPIEEAINCDCEFD